MEKLLNKELTVISAVINDGDMPALLQASPELFEAYEDVYSFIVDYYQKNRDLPPRKIVEDKFAIRLVDEVGSTRHHIEELRNLYLKKQLRDILRSASQKLQDGELAAAISGMVSATSNLKKDTSDIRDMDATDVDDAIAHIERVKEMNARGVYGVQFGIPGIDDFLPSGVVPGMLGLILGYPGRGKSFLTTLMAVNAWDLNKRVLYVSLEMTEAEVRGRVYAIAGKGKWSLRQLQRGNVDTSDFKTWANVRFEEKNEFPIISNDGYGRFTPAALRAKIEEYSPDIVFVDYLQLMAPDAGGDGNETIKLKNLSTELKLLAMATATPIVGVVSATPSDATDMNSIPELGQVAWSKQLAYDADWLLAVGRSDNSPIMGIAWRKNRNGPLFDFVLECDFDKGVFNYKEDDFDDSI
jgi:replicative DNA helicase